MNFNIFKRLAVAEQQIVDLGLKIKSLERGVVKGAAETLLKQQEYRRNYYQKNKAAKAAGDAK